jgi:hypothetical protein
VIPPDQVFGGRVIDRLALGAERLHHTDPREFEGAVLASNNDRMRSSGLTILCRLLSFEMVGAQGIEPWTSPV